MSKKNPKKESSITEEVVHTLVSEVLVVAEATETSPGARKYVKPVIVLGLWVSLLALFSFSLYLVPPQTIIAHIGVSNAYILIFVLSLFGGVMTFSGVPYHLIMVSFVLTGFNPFLLGAVAGLGEAMGDSTSYGIGYFGRVLLSERMKKALVRIERIKEKYPRLLPVVFFLYGSLVPFSSDVFTIPMGLIRYPFWRLMIPLGLGSMVFNIGLALIAVYAYDWLVLLF